ncbi:MAG: hypothetical protein ABIN89_27800 [Chitinophagaceae bacterium]
MLLAFVPPLWFKIMDAQLDRFQQQFLYENSSLPGKGSPKPRVRGYNSVNQMLQEKKTFFIYYKIVYAPFIAMSPHAP